MPSTILLAIRGAELPQLQQHLRSLVTDSGITGLAERAGLTPQGVRKALKPGSEPGMGTLLKVIDALGLQLNLVRKEE